MSILFILCWLLQPQESRQHIIIEVPIAERMSLLERDVEYLNGNLMKLHDELRSETQEIRSETRRIREILQEQDNQLQTWLIFIIGLIVAGDRALAITKKVREGRLGK